MWTVEPRLSATTIDHLERDYVAEQAEKEDEAKQARKEWVWAMGKEMAHRLVDQYWGGQTNED